MQYGEEETMGEIMPCHGGVFEPLREGKIQEGYDQALA